MPLFLGQKICDDLNLFPGALKLAQEDGPWQNDAVAYQYDALGRLANHSSALGSFDYAYLGQTGQPARLRLSGTSIGSDWEYLGNDGDRRLSAITHSGRTRGYRYTTTAEGLATQAQETATATAPTPATWNNAGRLSAAQGLPSGQYGYAYDPVGNLDAITGPNGAASLPANSLNQVAAANGQPWAYDAAGNLTDDGTRSYQWDAAGRLVRIGYKSAPAKNTSFRYDGLGRRVSIRSDNGTGFVFEFRYLWCGEALCQARTTADAPVRRYYPEGEVRPLGNMRLYHARDRLASARLGSARWDYLRH